MKNDYAPSKSGIVLMLCLCFSIFIYAQTTPPAQVLQYNQTFSFAHTNTFYPTGWQGWSLGTSASATFRTTAPTGNSNLLASSTAATTTGGVHNYNGKIGILTSGAADPALGLAINTTGFSNIQVKFDAMTIRNPFDGITNTFILGIDLQYRVGSISGTWTTATSIANGFYQNNTTLQTGTVTTPQNLVAQAITLPAACNNQPFVYLRWVVRDISGTGSRPSFAIDNVVICPILTPTISIVGPNASCSAQTMTFLSMITNGGTTPVYSWKKNGTTIGINASTLTTSGLVAGDQISCNLNSSLGCLTSATVSSNIISIITASAPVINSAIITNNCSGTRNGKIDISVSGGTPPYTIAWDTSNTVNGTMFAVTLGNKTANTPIPGGIAQSFFIDGIESKELFLTKGLLYTFNITAGHPFHISTDLTGGNANFFVASGQTGSTSGTSFGTITFKPNATHPPLLYYPCAAHALMGWKVNIQNGFLVEDPTNLNAGIYNVIVTDANGCTTTGQYTVSNITSTLNVSATVDDATCSTSRSGSINLTVTGGTPPYSICWDTVNTSNGNQFAVSFAAKTAAHPMFGQGSAFGYVIDGVEGKAISLIRDVPYSFNVMTTNHPFRITTDLQGGTTNNVVANGQFGAPAQNGTVTFTPNSTHPSLLYYSCEFHQFMGYNVNIVDGYCIEDLSNLLPGIYTVIVKDATGCYFTSQFTINAPPPISLSANVNDATCNGSSNGSIDLNVSGGNPPYTICWDTSNTDNGNQFAVTFGPKTASHPLFGQGSAFGYIINGIEGKELSLTKGLQYDFNVMTTNHPFRITTDLEGGTTNNVVTSGQTGAPTQNGIVSFTPDNSHPALLYYSCEFHLYMGYNVNIVDGYCIEDLTGLHAGVYTVIVSDANGCTSTSQFTVGQPPSISLSAAITEENCTLKNGAIDLTVSGGTGPYTTCWDTANAEVGTQFGVTFAMKSASHPLFGQGSAFGYIINGKEAVELNLTRGVQYSFDVMTTNHPFRITTDLEGGTTNNVVANGQTGAPAQNGTVGFLPDNTHPTLLYYSCEFHQYMGYNINISDGYCMEDISDLHAGSYSVVVTDANGCSSVSNFIVGQVPVVAEICFNGLDDDCNGNIDDGCSITLNLNLFLQGYYSGGGMMNNFGSGGCLFMSGVSADPTDADTVVIGVMDELFPYGLIDEQKGVLKTNGQLSVTLNSIITPSQSYYLKINHRNSIETWSKLPLLFSPVTNYSFSIAASQAFGDNEIETVDAGVFAIFSGDINQDGAIDGSDFLELDPSIQIGDGGYKVGDVNGDGSVDGSDFLLLDPNIQIGVGAAIP